MNDLEKYTDFIYGDQRGYVYAPIKKDDSWEQKFFQWPTQKTEFHDWIHTNSIDPRSQVYVSPAIYKERRATKADIKSIQVVWVEFDGQEHIEFTKLGMKPHMIVQTSSLTHVHCYWRVGHGDPKVLEEINLRLTYFLGADTSGYDMTQLLRPPDSFNRKPEYVEPYPVLLSYYNPGTCDTSVFDSAPKVEVKTPTLSVSELLDYKKVIQEVQLPLSLQRMVVKEVAVEPHRSSFLSKVAFELAEQGLSHLQLVSLLNHVDERIGKFKGRRDRMLRLSQLADITLHKKAIEDAVLLYDLDDVIKHSTKLDWILPGWLHKSGFMILTSAPNVGKTQMIMQLGVCLIKGELFLGKGSMVPEHKIMFWSIEMPIEGIKYIAENQQKHWGNVDRSRFLVIDDEISLNRMEDILDEHKPTVFFIDSLSEILGNSTDHAAEAKTAMRWIKNIRRRYGLAVVAIHHNRKSNENNRKPNKLSDLYGSFIFAKDPDTVINLWENGNSIDVDALKVRYGEKGPYKTIKRNENLWFVEESKEKKDASKDSGRPSSDPNFDF